MRANPAQRPYVTFPRDEDQALAETTTPPAPEPPRYQLGVLFVHGIGDQTRGATLTDFGTPLVDWIRSIADQQGVDARIGRTVLSDASDDPASSEIFFASNNGARAWLLAESWWAQSFPVARFRDVARWSLLIVPWTIGTHFAKRIARGHGRRRFASGVRGIAALVGGLLLSPLVLLVVAVLLALGKIPWPPLQNTVANLQLAVAASLGDSYLLVARPVEAAAIRTRVRRDIKWLKARCARVAVVAHSQGGAVTCQLLADHSSGVELLITFGSGLRKLEELADARRSNAVVRGALVGLFGLVAAAVTIAVTPAVAYQVVAGPASAVDLVVLAVVGAVATLVAIAGIQDFVHARGPSSLRSIADCLRKNSIQWEDVYSSADPVPNGPVQDDGAPPPNSTEIVNLGSVLRDHTTYWQNLDCFVPLVGDTLLAFDGSGILVPTEPDVTTFLRAQRLARVALLQAIGWITGGCGAALVIVYRHEWAAMAVWASQRALRFAGGVVGWMPDVRPTPDVAVWQMSVGWLAAVLALGAIARGLWTSWNKIAMDDARRADYRVRPPYAVLLAVFVELVLTGIAVWSLDGAFIVALTGMLFILIPVVLAQARVAPPRVPHTTAPPATPSSILVLTALKELFFLLLPVLLVLTFGIMAALRLQGILIAHIGRGSSWTAAGVVIAASALASVKMAKDR